MSCIVICSGVSLERTFTSGLRVRNIRLSTRPARSVRLAISRFDLAITARPFDVTLRSAKLGMYGYLLIATFSRYVSFDSAARRISGWLASRLSVFTYSPPSSNAA